MIILLILALLFQPVPAPIVQAHWTAPSHVRIDITQLSNADLLCIYYREPGRLLGCVEGHYVEHVITWPQGPTDGEQQLREGDRFWVRELREGEIIGVHGPYEASWEWRVFFPLAHWGK